MKRTAFWGCCVLFLALLGCGGGGESLINPWLADQFKDQENNPTGSPLSFSISGNILLPSDTVATLATSLKVDASLSAQINPGLNFLRFRVRVTDASGTTIAGPFSPDATGRFSVTGIPGGSNRRIEFMASNDQPVLKKHLDRLSSNLSECHVDALSTAMAILVQESGCTIKVDDLTEAAQKHWIDLAVVITAVENVLRGTLPLSWAGIHRTVVGNLGSERIQEMLKGVSLKNLPPVVEIVQPSNAASFAFGKSITIIASATDPDGTVTMVEMYTETGKLGQCSTSPCQFIWDNPPPGIHFLSAKASDNLGLVHVTASLTITVASPMLVSISLNPATAALNLDSGFDLSSMRGIAHYENNSESPVSSLTWSLSSGGGTISGNTYNTPSSSGTAELKAVYTEAGVTRSASFPITLGLYSLNWLGDLEAAKIVSSATNRNIYISFASTACGWSRLMASDTYSNPDIVNVLNSAFIPVQIVLQNSSTRHYFDDYNVLGTPHGIVLKARTLTVMTVISGYKTPASFSELLNGYWN